MFDNPFTHRTTIRLTLVLAAVLWVAPPLPNHANAEGAVTGADLRARFEALSQHGNVECSVQFEKLIGTMGPEGRLEGSCCAPMDEARYCQQIEGLKKY